jgi:hypothetical protein
MSADVSGCSTPAYGDDGGSEAGSPTAAREFDPSSHSAAPAVETALEPAFQSFLNCFLSGISEGFAACVEGWAGADVFTNDALAVYKTRSRHPPGGSCAACEALDSCRHMPALSEDALSRMQPDQTDPYGFFTK